jgi:hypothetical protein
MLSRWLNMGMCRHSGMRIAIRERLRATPSALGPMTTTSPSSRSGACRHPASTSYGGDASY